MKEQIFEYLFSPPYFGGEKMNLNSFSLPFIGEKKYISRYLHSRLLGRENKLKYIFTSVYWGEKTYFPDKVAQLVRCRTSNQRVAGSNPGCLGHFGLILGNIVYPILLQSTQLYNGYLA